MKIFRPKQFLKGCLYFSILNVILKILYRIYTVNRVKRLWKQIPGRDVDPTAKFIKKNFKRFYPSFGDFILADPNHDIYKLPLPTPGLLLFSPKSVEWLLKEEFENVTNPGPGHHGTNFFHSFIGEKSMFALRHGSRFPREEKNWWKQRKVASLVFTKNNFMHYFHEIFVEKGNKLIRIIENNNGSVIDIQALFFSFTMDATEKFIFGLDGNILEGGESKFAKAFDNAHYALNSACFGGSVFFAITKLLLPFPLGPLCGLSQEHSAMMSLSAFLFKSLNKDFREMKHQVSILEDYVNNFIEKAQCRENLDGRKDVLSNFLKSKLSEGMSKKQIRQAMLSLVFAGRDTTACTMSWLLFMLTQHKKAQRDLASEVEKVLGGRIPTMEDVDPSKMPYLNGVVYETLRLHAPVQGDAKVSSREIKFPNGVLIPKNTWLIYSSWIMGRNPLRYSSPLEFRPERWIPFVQPTPFEFPAFQAGPRICLGKDMAILEVKLLTVMLLQRFKFELKPGEAEKINYSLTMTKGIVTDKNQTKWELLVIPHVK